jgi:Ca-activated chloride channel family protein
MTLLPVLPPWLFWILAALLAGSAAALLAGRRTPARWRYATLVLLLVAAAARPGIPGASAPVAAAELNVFFVVDTTPSAGAEDYDGNKLRLDGMKGDIKAIAGRLAGARFSLITFDTTAKVVLPLTTDATALRTSADILSPQTAYVSRGSSVTGANALLGSRLDAAAKAHPERPRLVFYLGDGEQTSANPPEPFAAGTKLVDGGAVLGYGTSSGGRMRDYAFGTNKPGDYITDRSTQDSRPALSVIDEKTLQAIAAQLGVPYVHRPKPAGIDAALADSAPRAAVAAGTAERPGAGRTELYWLPALAGFCVALGGLLASGRALARLGRAQGRDA